MIIRPYPQSTVAGRVLMALRAGDMTLTELAERFGLEPAEHAAKVLSTAGLVERVPASRLDVIYRITPNGRAVCPCRRDPVRPLHMRISEWTATA